MPVDQTLHECFRRDDKTSWIDTLGFKKRNENVWRENSNLYGLYYLSFSSHSHRCMQIERKIVWVCLLQHTMQISVHTFLLFHFYFFFQAKKEAIPLCFLMKKGLHFHVCISDAHSAQKSAKNEDISVLCFIFHIH